MSGALFMNCSNSAQKVDKAQQNVIEANKNLDNANQAYEADIADYRTETANIIATNDKSINDFKARIAKDKKIAKDDYNKKIADLERKNSDMKKRMDDYKADSRESWVQFKDQFSRDMEELGKAFKDFTIKN
jgi:hypothetical protein